MNWPAAGLFACLVVFVGYLLAAERVDAALADIGTDDDLMDLADVSTCLCGDCVAWTFRRITGGAA